MRFTVVDPECRRALEAMTAYFDELAERFDDGFDPGDTLVVDAPGFRPPAGVFVIAIGDDDTIACGGVQTIKSYSREGATASLRRTLTPLVR
jgi:hypothetical protein